MARGIISVKVDELPLSIRNDEDNSSVTNIDQVCVKNEVLNDEVKEEIHKKIICGLTDDYKSEDSTSYGSSYQEVIVKEEPPYDEELQNDEDKDEMMIDFPACDTDPLTPENDPLEIDHCIKKEIKHEEFEVSNQDDEMRVLGTDYFCPNKNIDHIGKQCISSNEESNKLECVSDEMLKESDGETGNLDVVTGESYSGLSDSKSDSNFDVNSKQSYRKQYKVNIEKGGCTNSDEINSNSRKYVCNCCNTSFNRLDHLKTHSLIHTGEKPFSCKICHNTYRRSTDLTRHLRAHTGEKPFTCEVCLKTFRERYALTSHSRIHTGEKPFSCKFCKKSFCRSENLKQHLRKHTGERPYICDICNESFITSVQLKNHLRGHTGDKPFTCDVCNKSFGTRTILRCHLITHTGVKRFSCEICKKSFSQVRTLTSHIRTHTGEKPYSCNVCGKDFSVSCNLSTHLRTHTGIKAYSCKICERSFSKYDSVKNHVCSRSSKKPY